MAKTSESEKTRGDPLASSEEKEKALEAARLQIEKQFGSGSLMKLGTHTSVAGIEVIPSGSILLDEALGIGGYPRGRIIEIYGPESSGKTTLALHAIAEAQKLGGIAAFVDAEHALDPVYAKNLGVNIDELWISQPDTGEQALEITESLVRSGAVDVIVVDSVAALTPQAEIDGDMGDAQMGLQARLMSQAMRKLTAIIGKSRTVLIFINQIRMKIGMLFGNPETTTGGNALKFYSSLRLEVRRTETIEGGKDADAVGNRVKVKVVKNKVAPPFRKADLEVIFGKGVSASASLLDGAVKYGLIDKKGAWYSYGEEKVAQGRDSARDYLEQNPAFAKQIEEKLRKIIFPGREFPAAKPGSAENPAAEKSAAENPAAENPAAENPAAPGVSGLAAASGASASGAVSGTGQAPAPGDGQPEPLSSAPEDPVSAGPDIPAAPVRPEPAPRPETPSEARPEPRFDLEPGVQLPSSRPILEPVEAPRRGPGRPPSSQPVPGPAASEAPRRGPGRPPLSQPVPGPAASEAPRRGPGRPPLSQPVPEPASAEAPRRGPGRPRKTDFGDDGDALF
jgi:recombination protein RecA